MTQLGLLVSAPKETSFRCYQQIVAEGLLSRMRLAVWTEIIRHGPLTGSELDARLTASGGRGHRHKRLPELARVGMAVALSPRLCRVTGRLATPWQAVDALPCEPQARPTRLEAFAEGLAKRFEASRADWNGPMVAHVIRQAAREAR